MSVVLRVDDVHVVRDGRPILQEVSLTVRVGEHRAPLGANGAGKSTLLGLLGALSLRRGGPWRSSAAGWAASTCANCGPGWVMSAPATR